MAAVAYERHGDSSVLKFRRDYPRPGLLPHQILVAVSFASLNPCDFKFRRATAAPSSSLDFLFPKPKITSEDLSGTVVAIGASVPVGAFAVGDRVAAMLPIMHSRWGALAEYVEHRPL